MRRDELYLRDITESADALARFTSDVAQARFIDDDLVRSAVLQKLVVIGEAASRISQEIRERYGHNEWRDIVAFRNIAVHAYFNVDWNVVWNAAIKDAPEIKQQISAILTDEFPES